MIKMYVSIQNKWWHHPASSQQRIPQLPWEAGPVPAGLGPVLLPAPSSCGLAASPGLLRGCLRVSRWYLAAAS